MRRLAEGWERSGRFTECLSLAAHDLLDFSLPKLKGEGTAVSLGKQFV
jgi:hypothetical protein